MTAMAWIGAALLTVLLLPAIAGEAENRTIPWPYHAVLALIGISFVWATRGMEAAVFALLTGIMLLALLGFATASLSRKWGLRLLSGGDIRLLAAAAAWVGPAGAVPMLAITATAFFAVVILVRAQTKKVVRPAVAMITGFCVVAIFLGYYT